MTLLQSAGLPPAAQVELKKRAVRKAMPNLDPRVSAQIDAELAAMGTVMQNPAA